MSGRPHLPSLLLARSRFTTARKGYKECATKTQNVLDKIRNKGTHVTSADEALSHQDRGLR
jgi:hypothetical protein